MAEKPIRDMEKEQNREIQKNYSPVKESYQPTEDTLDNDNPPGGGSGVPDKVE
jgi:hypothetical protein